MRSKNRRRHRTGNRAALFALMIGFCILAVIEIAYGQIKMNTEKEKSAAEEKIEKQIPAIEKVQGNTASSGKQQETQEYALMDVVDKKTNGTGEQADDGISEEAAQTEENDAEEDDGYDMQIVFMGDSILDHVREDGVAAIVGEACNADVYNLSMGGTTAALEPGHRYDYENWDSRSLLGVVNGILGNIDRSIFDNYTAGIVMERCDFSKTDYFVIEYGVNDFLSQYPISIYMENGEVRDVDDDNTYAGALETAVTLLHTNFPNAKIILIAPHFCNFFEGETFIGDGYSLDYGYGPLIDYARVCGYVAGQHKEEGVMFYNAIEEGGIDAYNADECLKDGIHMTSRGRHVYSEYLIHLIKTDFYPEE